MTRTIIMAVTVIVVILLIIAAFQKDENLPEPTVKIEFEDQHKEFKETAVIPAETPEDQPEIRTGTYEFSIDKSVFCLNMEYDRIADEFKIINISDVVSRMKMITTETPYRAYHNNRISGSKMWGSNRSHLGIISYAKRILRGLWLGPVCGMYISEKEYSGLIGIGISYEW